MPEIASPGSVYRLVYAVSVCSEKSELRLSAAVPTPPTVIVSPIGRAGLAR